MSTRIYLAIIAVLMMLVPVSPSQTALAQAAPGGGKTPASPTNKPAETTQRLGAAQGWSAYEETAKAGKLCYLSGKPVKSEPADLKRGEVYAYVTHRTAEKAFNVVSFAAGYPFKDGSDVDLAVDGHKFSLFASKDTAWARDSAEDKAIVEAMAKGKQVMIQGTSARGTATTDTYNLAGFGQVLGQIDKACGVKR